MPVYIEMPRKITASHILFIAVALTSKGFVLYGCICTHTFKKYTFFGNGGVAALLLPRYERITFMGRYHIVAVLMYCEKQKTWVS